MKTGDIIAKWTRVKADLPYLNRLHKQLISTKSARPSRAQQVHNQVFDEINCLDCANCCKSIPPILSKRDIKRIAKAESLSTAAFEKKYVITDSDGDQVINASPCPFLEPDNKCRIYEVRPTACRTYPHSGDDLFHHNITHHKRNMRYCPALLEIVKRLVAFKEN